MRHSALIAVLVILQATCLHATIPWPMQPFDSAHAIGNSYGEFQDYDGNPYLHPGIDILAQAGTPVYAVKSGWVKAVLTTAADLHWRVAIGDSAGPDSCDGYLYAHLRQSTIAVSEGEFVDSGQYLGSIVTWPVANFHHLHFVKIRSGGTTWTSDWLFVGNPLDELVNATDTSTPRFLDISAGTPFRFAQDNTNTYFAVGGPVSGNVDIVAKSDDLINHPTWRVAPYTMGYEIYSDSVTLGPYTSFTFTGDLLWTDVTNVIYKDSVPCNSEGNYDQRIFYEVLTNHDGDPKITPADDAGNWATGQVPNDTYWIKAWSADQAGNIAYDSMQVTTANFFNIHFQLACSDGNPYPNYWLQVPFTGASDTVSTSDFTYPDMPAGTYEVSVHRPYYNTYIETAQVYGDITVNAVLTPTSYVNGDVDNSGYVSIADAVYLINYIFGGGPYPVIWASAVNIDATPTVSIGDAVYIINYIFGGGPPPGGGLNTP